MERLDTSGGDFFFLGSDSVDFFDDVDFFEDVEESDEAEDAGDVDTSAM